MQQKQRISALTIQTVENFAVYKASARYLHCGKINCVENQPHYIQYMYMYIYMDKNRAHDFEIAKNFN